MNLFHYWLFNTLFLHMLVSAAVWNTRSEVMALDLSKKELEDDATEQYTPRRDRTRTLNISLLGY